MPSPNSSSNPSSFRAHPQNFPASAWAGRVVVVLGTGGTIAGTSSCATDALGYRSAQLAVGELLSNVPGGAERTIESEQVAQIDSKDMDHATWLLLAQRVAYHLARREVAGVVITHGTDTLEETAYFLHRVLPSVGSQALPDDAPDALPPSPANLAESAGEPQAFAALQPPKPVVLTAAMRPATSVQADGPQNLADALTLVQDARASGVLVTMAGRVHLAARVRKQHTYALDALDSGDSGPVARIENAVVRWLWPVGTDPQAQPNQRPAALDQLLVDTVRWPRVFVLLSHAGADGAVVRALCAVGAKGLVVAGTGNGTIHAELEAALREASAAGVVVWRTTRCARGEVLAHDGDHWPAVTALSPTQARIELLLHLMHHAPR